MGIPRQHSKLSLPLMAVMTVAMGASVAVLPTSAATAAPANTGSTVSTDGLPSFVARDYKMTVRRYPARYHQVGLSVRLLRSGSTVASSVH